MILRIGCADVVECRAPTRPLIGTIHFQKHKNKTHDTPKKVITSHRTDHTKITKAKNKNTMQEERQNANILNRNRSLRWSTTRTNSKNIDTQKEDHTNTLQLRNKTSINRLSGHKRKIEDELNIPSKNQITKKGTKRDTPTYINIRTPPALTGHALASRAPVLG